MTELPSTEVWEEDQCPGSEVKKELQGRENDQLSNTADSQEGGGWRRGHWDEEHGSHCRPGQEIFMRNNGLKRLLWDFLGGPVVKTSRCQCRGPRFDPWLGELVTSHILCSTTKILKKEEERENCDGNIIQLPKWKQTKCLHDR